ALLTAPEAARVIRVSPRRAYELAARGELPGVRRVGKRTFRVSRAELEAFVGAPILREELQK
ncbi:MAG: helix-turn-helix transcriptional regulator, partial [bacterium]